MFYDLGKRLLRQLHGATRKESDWTDLGICRVRMVYLPPQDMKTEMFTSSTTTADGCYIHCLVRARGLCIVFHSSFMLIGLGLIKAVRAVTFSPATTLLAAAGDSRIIALYDVSSGEQVANLSGHAAWVMSLDFSSTGEWLLSGFVPMKFPILFSLPSF